MPPRPVLPSGIRTRIILTSRQQLTRTQPYSSQQQPQPPKPKSATGEFYKTFTRPVAKTFLIAIFTYQLLYFGWAKLEQDEIKEDRTGMLGCRAQDKTLEWMKLLIFRRAAEIAGLEAEVERLKAVKEEEKARSLNEGAAVETGRKKGWWPF
ncbi:hypothetical protein B0T16DRAFT_404959 [Cercophora newfieldiana]|uniref:Uncharacterized protein n=1 Tax=Cercophora newfieldiana TaxID=92897 RepID=A0AA39YH90_9PEZI|nr:hypothetical protein B0T16DRAFT_404959 [Cercophora newfieldiana]